VARVLICEPNDDIRGLVSAIVDRLGHEPVACGEDVSRRDVDLAVIEPASECAHATAGRLGRRVPIICTSVVSIRRDRLGFSPVAYVMKPFSFRDLAGAIAAGLAAHA
jgi:hypothetical protein